MGHGTTCLDLNEQLGELVPYAGIIGQGSPIALGLLAIVDELLEGQRLRSVTLLAVDEAERAFLHEAVLHIVQSEG